MKKTVIGSVFMLSGVILLFGIIVAGTINLTRMTGGLYPGLSDSIQSLSLKLPLLLAIILAISGLVILMVEYFRKTK